MSRLWRYQSEEATGRIAALLNVAEYVDGFRDDQIVLIRRNGISLNEGIEIAKCLIFACCAPRQANHQPIGAFRHARSRGSSQARKYPALFRSAPEAWFDRLLALPGVRLALMPPRVLIASATLPGSPPKDPADRIIAATGRAFGYAIVTRDGELIPYARKGHIDTVTC